MIPAPTPPNLLAWSLQVAVLVFVGGGALCLARLQSPRLRLACFRALLVGCLALPFVQPLISQSPAAGLTLKPEAHDRQAATTAGSGLQPGAVQSDVVRPGATGDGQTSGVARGAWLPAWVAPATIVILGLGTVSRLAWLLLGLAALGRLRRKAMRAVVAAPATVARASELTGVAADIFTSPSVKHPVTFGLRRPVVLLPDSCASLDETEQVAVLCHELLHVHRRDWVQTVAEEVIRAVLWFHPAVWWLLSHIDLSREQTVDLQVVALTERREPYVNALVALALTPAGPILRPASLFLGRAHLLQRVALLSKEVRMSRPRLVASLVLVIAALAVGGRFVVYAFPLTAASHPGVAAPATSPARLAAWPSVAEPVRTPEPAPHPGGVLSSEESRAFAAGQAVPAARLSQRSSPEVMQRVEPVVAPRPADQSAIDSIVAMQVTIQPTGQVVIDGPIDMQGGGSDAGAYRMGTGGALHLNMASPEMLEAAIAAGQRAGWPPSTGDDLRSAVDAVRMWQFAPADQPFTTVIGFNFARAEQSGPGMSPIRIGGATATARRTRYVNPIYPPEAMQKHIQGLVTLDVTLDGAGIPIVAYGLRPIDGLTMAAIEAVLQWRFQPDASYSRRVMTVTVNFTLDGGIVGGIARGSPRNPPPPPAPVVGGVPGGVRGGIVGGVAGGVVGDVTGYADSFGPPQSEWPSNAVRVGGDIKQPTRLVNVPPVYPQVAQSNRVQGVVIVEVLIGTDGSVQAGRVLRSIPLLDQAAVEAVKQWQYIPTLVSGTPVPVIMTVTVNFVLQ